MAFVLRTLKTPVYLFCVMKIDEMDWAEVQKKPVVVEFSGPFYEPMIVQTLEGEYEIDAEYLEKHSGFVVVKGVEGEVYPCALEIFEETYMWTDGSDISLSRPED